MSYQTLSEEECLWLLAGVTFGRLALHAGALPTVALVDAVLTEDAIVVSSLPQPWFVNATDGAVVAFEADGIEPDAVGRWSVVVVGEATELSEMAPLPRARLDAALQPTSSVDAGRLVRISLAMISGNRRVDAGAVATPVNGSKAKVSA